MAQPTVSQAIIDLENYFQTRLFERLNHRLFLTASGERLRFFSRQVLNLLDQAQKELHDLDQGVQIRIGASLTIGTYLLPALLNDFRRQFANIEIFTRVDNTALIENLILEDQLDLGLVEGPVNSPYIREEAFGEDHLVFIASLHHPLVRKQPVTIQDLKDQVFIVREPGSATQAIFENAMKNAGVSWKALGVYNNNEAVKQAVIAGLGLAMVSEIAVVEETTQKKLIALEVQEIEINRKFTLVFHRQKYFTPAMQQFRLASLKWIAGKPSRFEP